MKKSESHNTAQNAVENAINTFSSPSDLKITDIRIAVVASNYDYPILRIDTNQGVYGLGEVRDAGHKENALQFKSMLLGQNPCNVDMMETKKIADYGLPTALHCAGSPIGFMTKWSE